MKDLKSRQVHLDFHTSELIPGVGTKFDKHNFQKALKLGNVNSITVFAKCHHSWSYYPTMVGKIHPTMENDFDLTGAMIDAAQEIGVKAPVYITVSWSSNDAINHPEWAVKNKEGKSNAATNVNLEEARPIVNWTMLCPNGEYAEYIYAQTKEICDRYDNLDGLFYDICFESPCWCESCLKGMKEFGMDSNNNDDVNNYSHIKWSNFMKKCTEILKEKHKEATIFFNGHGAVITKPTWHKYQTHFEMEDLPTVSGGYDKMPLRAKYFTRTDKDYLGMTGKFHTMWGEFGGFKNPQALKYECSAMSMYGARCSVGDQMHPCGEMNMDTYATIGEAYRYVEQLEPYCYNVEETSRLGVMVSNDVKTNEGITKILLEKQLDFNVVMEEDDFSRFDTIILPDNILLDEKLANKLNNYVEEGGSLLLTGQSGLNKDKSEFLIDIGAKHMGESDCDCDYVTLGQEINEGIVNGPFLFTEGVQSIFDKELGYMKLVFASQSKTQKVQVNDAKVLATISEPYFNRTYGQYCSHQNTPNKVEISDYPACIKKGKVIYLSHSMCKMYYIGGAQFHRDYVINALKLIYKEPVMQVNLLSSGRARFVNQKDKQRYILHLLYATPIKRGTVYGNELVVIEDLPDVYNSEVKVKVREKVKRVYLAPQNIDIPFKQENNNVEFTVNKFSCHQMIVIDY